jgi:hypothetical protein
MINQFFPAPAADQFCELTNQTQQTKMNKTSINDEDIEAEIREGFEEEIREAITESVNEAIEEERNELYDSVFKEFQDEIDERLKEVIADREKELWDKVSPEVRPSSVKFGMMIFRIVGHDDYSTPAFSAAALK